ncbi:MAG: phosphoserine phosphatase SerB [Desulfatiglandaceae bacterium]
MSFVDILTRYKASVHHLEQSGMGHVLSCFAVLEPLQRTESEQALREALLLWANSMHLEARFYTYTPEMAAHWVQRDRYLLTYFGDILDMASLVRIIREESGLIESMKTQSHHQARSMNLVIDVRDVSDMMGLKERIMVKSRDLGADLALQRMEAYRKRKRMIIFDVDSTLVEMEIIDEMARRAGVYEPVKEITSRAMNGAFDFRTAIIERVALLKGLGIGELEAIRDHLPLSLGVEELIAVLRRLGFKIGIISGGFDFFTEHLKEKLHLDYAFANRLEVSDGVLTGRVTGKIVDAEEKVRIVSQTACDEGILMDQTVAVGDGANDAPMLAQAGLGIAYNAKPRLDEAADASIGKSRMPHLFHFLGITEEDIAEVLSCTPSEAWLRMELGK